MQKIYNWRFSNNNSTEDIAQLMCDLQTVQNVCKSHKSWAIFPVLYLVLKFSIVDSFNPTKGDTCIQYIIIVAL